NSPPVVSMRLPPAPQGKQNPPPVHVPLPRPPPQPLRLGRFRPLCCGLRRPSPVCIRPCRQLFEERPCSPRSQASILKPSLAYTSATQCPHGWRGLPSGSVAASAYSRMSWNSAPPSRRRKTSSTLCRTTSLVDFPLTVFLVDPGGVPVVQGG